MTDANNHPKKQKNTTIQYKPNKAEMARLALENASWFYALYKQKKLRESLEKSTEADSTNRGENGIIKGKEE